jgi:hypothetical protein
LQGSIAQLSDYDPFHFSGGLDGGVKVSGVTILPHPTTKFGTCQVLAYQIFATTLVAISTNSTRYANWPRLAAR